MKFDLKKLQGRQITQAIMVLLSLGMVLGLTGCNVRTGPRSICDTGKHIDKIKEKQPQTPHCPEKCASSENLKACLNLNGDDLKLYILKLESQITNPEEKTENLERFFHLALLYSCSHNPSPDYGRALNNIKKYCDLAPENKKTNFKKYLLRLLTVLENRRTGLEKYKNKSRNLAETTQKLKVLTETNQSLKADYDKLAEENIKLKKIIEKLQYLDIRLENKRMPVD